MARTPRENGLERRGAAPESDRVLLTRFVRRQDEAAFAELVRRHAELVFGVCVRTVRDRHAAEDAFQLTFLALARSARKIRRRRALGSWLHSVARRIALQSLAKRDGRRETCFPMETITTDPTLRDVGEVYEQQLLDSELRELPVKYREPLVLHYLEGLSNRQVAERLDMSLSCVEGRLKRGKKELRLRLTRRGVEFGAVLAAVHLTTAAAQDASFESLIQSTAHIAATQSLTAPPATTAPADAAAQLAAKDIAMFATTKTPLLLTGAAAAVLAIGVTVGLDSPLGTLRAEGPQRTGALLDTTAAAEPSTNTGALAQADAAGTAEQPMTEDPRQTLQKLRGEIEKLKQDRELLSAQYQSDRAAADAVKAELNDLLALQEQENDKLRRQLQGAATGEPAAATAASEPAEGMEATWNFQSRDPQTDRILAALDAETEIEFLDTPLSDVLAFIGELYNVPIVFDDVRTSELGIDSDVGVFLELSGVSLKSALELMLNKLDLDYVVENQVLNVTTREYADSVMETRVYSLQPLPADCSPDDLARVVIRSIAPDTWRNSVILAGGYGDAGIAYEDMLSPELESVAPTGGLGNGSIEPLPGVLVVTQSQRVHRQIVDLLSQLKRQHAAAGMAGGNYPMGMGGMPGTGYDRDAGFEQPATGSGSGNPGDTRRGE